MNTSNIRNYKPKDFAELLGGSVKTLQRWDREGILKANRTPTDRRHYTYDQYLQFKGIHTEWRVLGVRPSYDFLTMNLHFLKGRKLLITAGVYESEVAEKVQDTFEKYRETQSYKEAILSTANTLQLSKASVTSYLPYQKGVYFPSTADKEKISVGAERQRRYRAIRKLRSEPTEEHLWETVLLYCGVQFKTYSGLPFTYEIRKGRSGEYTKELWIDRRGKSKSLAWSSVLLALGNIKKVGEVVERPKALSDIRGVTYIYGMFYRFGLIDVPKEVKEKKNDRGNKKQKKGREDMLEENIKFFRRL